MKDRNHHLGWNKHHHPCYQRQSNRKGACSVHARRRLWEGKYQLFIFPCSVQICCKMTPKMELVISMSNGHCPCWWRWEIIDKQNTTLNIFQIKNVEGADWRHRKNCGLRLRRPDLPKALSLKIVILSQIQTFYVAEWDLLNDELIRLNHYSVLPHDQ